ncbi:MAG: ABC transporter ATP-binding protein [Hyphomonadaceae bacterium]
MTKVREPRKLLGSDLAMVSRLLLSHGRRRIGWTMLLLIASAVAEGASLLLLAPLLHLAQGQAQFLPLSIPFPWAANGALTLRIGLSEALACLCAMVVTQSLLGRARSVVMSSLLGAVVNNVRLSLFDAISRTRWSYVSRQRTADLAHLMTADVDRIQSVTFSFLMLLQSLLAIVIYTAVSSLISPAMTLFAAVCGAAILLLMQPVRRLATTYGSRLTERRRQQHRIVSEFLSGMKVAKSFNAEKSYVAELSGELSSSQRDLTRFVRASATGTALLQVGNVVILAVFVFGAVKWFALPMTELVVLILVYMRVSPRFTAIQASMHELLVNAPALRAVEQMRADCLQNVEEAPAASGGLAFEDAITLDMVTYRYGSDQGGVSDVSLTAPARSVTALVGGSGAGKSTVADLVMGLIAPEAGRILIDGVALDDGNRRRWRDSVAYVPQDTFLLNDTIEANLRIARPQATQADLADALRAAGAEGLVDKLPEGILTVVGERGGRMSGGERQRIALARAILRKPRVLILDEATSSLDAENRALIMQSIRGLRDGMAVLLITHDPAMLEIADSIVTLEGGAVVETSQARLRIAERSRRNARTGSA